jgi:hypothetical protein
LSPWHKSSQPACSAELSTAGSERKLSAVADAGCGVDAGAEAEGGCGNSDFADADSPRDLGGGPGFRARLTDEFNQKEILAVPSACRTV